MPIGWAIRFAADGVNPEEVYSASEKLVGKLMPSVGTIFSTPVYSDLQKNTPNLRINILRDKAVSFVEAPCGGIAQFNVQHE